MMSLRSFSRAISKPLVQFSSRTVSRSLVTIPRPALARLQPTKAISRPSWAAFSTTRAAFEKEGQVDQELAAKLESELQMEQEVRDDEALPTTLSDYLASSTFELHDTPGQEDVVLTRKFGDEKIRVTFSIADLNTSMEEHEDYSDDNAMYDEPEPSDVDALNAQSGGGNSKTAVQKGTPQTDAEETEALEEGEGAEEAPTEPSWPAHLTVTVEKPGNGTLQIETTAQDGEIVIEQVSFFKKPELADAKTAELDWKRRNVYEGPPFANLDEDLQVLLERYLDERGINTALALWVPEYVDWKEQKEYLGWLTNVKKFVDA